jgi:hypothetical protein
MTGIGVRGHQHRPRQPGHGVDDSPRRESQRLHRLFPRPALINSAGFGASTCGTTLPTD